MVNRYSIIILGSIDEVIPLMDRYNVKLEKADFAKSVGYEFEVEEEIIGGSPLVIELRKKTREVALSYYTTVKL